MLEGYHGVNEQCYVDAMYCINDVYIYYVDAILIKLGLNVNMLF